MIEFVGSKEILDFAKEEGFKTIRMTFEDSNPKKNREYFNVFEISEEEFQKMCNYEDENGIHVVGEKYPMWKDSWGWWRYSGGCNLEGTAPTTWMTINNHQLVAWYDKDALQEYFDDNEDDGDIQSVYDEWMEDHDKYDSLFDYCLEMWGCSTERNVTAIAVGLAKLNNMSLSDLFKLSIAL